jgi:hypothetical protein
MKRILLAAILAAGPAMADMVASNGAGDELRLFDRPCAIESIRARINPEYVDKFQAAQAIVGGKVIRACYIDTGEGFYYLMPEGAEQGIAYPVTIFISSPGV